MQIPRLMELLASRTALLVLIPVIVVAAGIIQGWPFPEGSDSAKRESQASHNPTRRETIRLMAVSEDGAFLDVAQGDGDFVRRDALTGRRLNEIDVPRGAIPWALFDGREETWAGINQQNRLEVARNGARIWKGTLPDQSDQEKLVHCGVYLSRGLVTVASESGFLWVLDFDEEQAVPRGPYSVGEPLSDGVLSPSGEHLILMTDAWQFVVWDIAQEKIITRLDAEESAGRFAAWSEDGRRLITLGHNPEMSVWDVPAGRLVRRLKPENKLVTAAALSLDGALAAFGDGDDIRIWDVQSGTVLTTLIGHQGLISVLRFADRGRTLFSGDSQGGLRRWSLSDFREIWATP